MILQTETGPVLVTFFLGAHWLQSTEVWCTVVLGHAMAEPWLKLAGVHGGTGGSGLTSQGSHEVTCHPSAGHVIPTVILFLFPKGAVPGQVLFV